MNNYQANFKNTVPRKYGNEYEFPLRCKHCSEVPKQGWSFMGSFIWCENEECNNRLYSDVATANQLGQWWDMVQTGRCSPATFPKQLWDDVELTDEQATKWSDAENASRAEKDLTFSDGKNIGDVNSEKIMQLNKKDDREPTAAICRHCNGTGKTRYSSRSITEIKARCFSCNGTGEIQNEGDNNGTYATR